MARTSPGEVSAPSEPYGKGALRGRMSMATGAPDCAIFSVKQRAYQSTHSPGTKLGPPVAPPGLFTGT